MLSMVWGRHIWQIIDQNSPPLCSALSLCSVHVDSVDVLEVERHHLGPLLHLAQALDGPAGPQVDAPPPGTPALARPAPRPAPRPRQAGGQGQAGAGQVLAPGGPLLGGEVAARPPAVIAVNNQQKISTTYPHRLKESLTLVVRMLSERAGSGSALWVWRRLLWTTSQWCTWTRG